MALNIRKAGEQARGVVLALMGERGAGKTSLAASFPAPLVLAVEDGTQALSEMETAIADLPPERGTAYKETMLGALRAVAATDYRTIVIDSVTAMLAHLTHDLVKDEKPHARSLMAACGGYGKARDVLVQDVEELMKACQWLARERGKHIVLVLHQKVRTVSMPDREDFDRVEPEGQRDALASILNPCDIIGMVEQAMDRIEKGGKVIVEGDGSRQLLVGPHPAIAIKSRFHKELTAIPVVFGENPLPGIIK